MSMRRTEREKGKNISLSKETVDVGGGQTVKKDLQRENELRFKIQGEKGSFLTFIKKGDFYFCQNCTKPPQSGQKEDRRKRAGTHGIKESSIREHARDEHRLKISWSQVEEEVKLAIPLPSISCKYCGKEFKRYHQGCKNHERKCKEKPAIEATGESDCSQSKPTSSTLGSSVPGPSRIERVKSSEQTGDSKLESSPHKKEENSVLANEQIPPTAGPWKSKGSKKQVPETVEVAKMAEKRKRTEEDPEESKRQATDMATDVEEEKLPDLLENLSSRPLDLRYRNSEHGHGGQKVTKKKTK